MRRYAEFFVDLWLQEYEFQRYDSHTMVWAIVLASKRAVHFRKYGTKSSTFFLIEVFRVSKNVTEKFINFIFLLFQTKLDARKQRLQKKNLIKTILWRKIARQLVKQQVSSSKDRTVLRVILWNIESKNVHYSKPRNYTKRNDSIQKRDNSSIPRITTNTEILKCLKDASLYWNITTPDKLMITNHKSSSINKKSSIKRFKPNIMHQSHIPKPIMYDSNQRKPKIQSRNPKIDWRKTSKLDFDMTSIGMKVDSSTKSRKSLNPWNTSYQHISHNSSAMDASYNKENIINQSNMQGFKPNLKLKIAWSKICTTMGVKQELSRNKSFLKSNSKTFQLRISARALLTTGLRAT